MKSTLSFALLSVALSLGLLACAGPQTQELDLDQLRQTIEEANTQFVQAFKQGDAAAVAALYTEDAVLLPPNSDMVRGKQSIQEFTNNFIQMGIQDFSLTTVDVGGSGDTAYEIGRYVLTFQPQDHQAVQDSGKYVVVWKKQADGSWKLHVDIWNSSVPMAPVEQ